MKQEEILTTLIELSNKMTMDEQCIETYAKTLGYNISLKSDFQHKFEREVWKLFPVTNYMSHENFSDKSVLLGQIKHISKKMLFAIENPQLYMVNRFYHIIESISDKNRTVKMESSAHILQNTLNIFSINHINVKKQANGKVIFYFDESNFEMIKNVLMHSNEYTNTVLKCITMEHKEMFAKNKTLPDILSSFMSPGQISTSYDYINKYLLTQALKIK